MKVVCNREGLLSACQLASVAVASRDVKPVLKNLKAVVDNERCTLMATDLELGIRLEVRGASASRSPAKRCCKPAGSFPSCASRPMRR